MPKKEENIYEYEPRGEYNALATEKEVKDFYSDIPQTGLWFVVLDFSERDYSTHFGFYGFHNGKCVYCSGGSYGRHYGKVMDAAREWKKRVSARLRAKQGDDK